MVQFKSKLRHIDLFTFVSGGKDHFKRTLANNTVAHRSYVDGSVSIAYHGNTIAELTNNDVYVSNCGWGSPTTRERINSVLKENGIPFHVSQKNHKQILTRIDKDESGNITRTILNTNFWNATFHRTATGWSID